MKIETKFTPGPWEFQNATVVTTKKDLPIDRVWGYGQTEGFICDLDDGEYHNYKDDAELIANGNMIASAPEMYEALDEALKLIEVVSRQFHSKIAAEILERGYAVMNKARGEE